MISIRLIRTITHMVMNIWPTQSRPTSKRINSMWPRTDQFNIKQPSIRRCITPGTHQVRTTQPIKTAMQITSTTPATS